MSKYALQGSFKAKSGERDALAKILSEASNLMSNAKGCHLYLVCVDETDSQTVYINEVWDSKADHDASLNVDGVRALIGQAMPLIDGPPVKGLELKVVSDI